MRIMGLDCMRVVGEIWMNLCMDALEIDET